MHLILAMQVVTIRYLLTFDNILTLIRLIQDVLMFILVLIQKEKLKSYI